MTTVSTRRLKSLAPLALLVACGTESTQPLVDQTRSAVVHLEAMEFLKRVGAVGATVSYHPFLVLAHDGSSPVSGVPIVWEVTGVGASISPANDITKSDGRAAATVTLGPGEGNHTITAAAPTLPGAPRLTWTATAVTRMVQIRDLADGGFTPGSVTVLPGSSVGWRYDSGEGDVHNMTFEDGITSRDFYDVVPGPGYYTRLFEGLPRTVRYRCTHHSSSFVEGEVGTVVVQP
jgi:plastocyanin